LDTGGNNQGQGRQSQGQEVQGNGGHERRGLQNKTGHKTQHVLNPERNTKQMFFKRDVNLTAYLTTARDSSADY